MTYRPNPLRPDPKPVSPIVKSRKPLPKKKPTGEAALFKAIWATRKHVSYVKEKGRPVPLGDDAYPYHFSHVLPKGKYPHFRLYDRNIVLMTYDQHFLWGNARHKIKDDPEWQPVFMLEAELKKEYEQQFNEKKK